MTAAYACALGTNTHTHAHALTPMQRMAARKKTLCCFCVVCKCQNVLQRQRGKLPKTCFDAIMQFCCWIVMLLATNCKVCMRRHTRNYCGRSVDRCGLRSTDSFLLHFHFRWPFHYNNSPFILSCGRVRMPTSLSKQYSLCTKTGC